MVIETASFHSYSVMMWKEALNVAFRENKHIRDIAMVVDVNNVGTSQFSLP